MMKATLLFVGIGALAVLFCHMLGIPVVWALGAYVGGAVVALAVRRLGR
jgi:hypothetical protein